MNKGFCFSIVLMGVFALAGCAENKTRVAEGAGIGGVLGSAAGGIIGYQTHHPVAGALIGAAAGAAAGGVIGAQINKPQTPQAAGTTTPATAATASPLTVQDVVNKTKEGVSGDEIIAEIQSTNSKYSLTADDLAYLKKQGVAQRVIDVMQATTK